MGACPGSLQAETSIALGISAIIADQTPLLPAQRLCAAAWADAPAAAVCGHSGGALTGRQCLHLRGLLLLRPARRGQKAGADHVGLDDATDSGEQARYIAPAHPLTTLGVEHGLELLDDEGDVAAAAEDGADHTRQRYGPGVVLEVLGVDEDLEGTPPDRRPAPGRARRGHASGMIALDVVDGDVHGVIAAGPAQLVGVAGEHRLALERLGHVDDLSLAIGKDQSGKE